MVANFQGHLVKQMQAQIWVAWLAPAMEYPPALLNIQSRSACNTQSMNAARLYWNWWRTKDRRIDLSFSHGKSSGIHYDFPILSRVTRSIQLSFCFGMKLAKPLLIFPASSGPDSNNSLWLGPSDLFCFLVFFSPSNFHLKQTLDIPSVWDCVIYCIPCSFFFFPTTASPFNSTSSPTPRSYLLQGSSFLGKRTDRRGTSFVCIALSWFCRARCSDDMVVHKNVSVPSHDATILFYVCHYLCILLFSSNVIHRINLTMTWFSLLP